jgi:arginine exporter protein ArgO
VIVTRTVVILGALFYVFLWVLAMNGATRLVAPLAVPGILAIMIAVGVALNRWMGMTPRKQHFRNRNDETEQ